MPKVSVIIPVYNVEKYLKQCLDSVVNQTLKDIEIICIDDGSTDSSPEILQEYVKKDERIKIITQQNKGSASARNSGIKKAKGEYIGFIDADDYISINYYEELYNAATKSNADISATNQIILVENGQQNLKKCGINNCDKKIISIKDKSKIIITTGVSCNKIYKNKFLKQNKINCLEIKNPAEDNYFTDLAVICANKIAINNNCSYYYVIHNNSQTQKLKTKMDFKVFDVYKLIENRILKMPIKKNDKFLWLKIINERKKRDFKVFYDTMSPEYKEEFKAETKKYLPPELIVSLTSYPARINTVNQTIESLLNQSLKADKVILWLAEEQFPNKEKDLPRQLLDLVPQGLTIDWCEDIKSYKKLIPALKKYPDAIIVTADDDLLYDNKWLEQLYNAYLKNPHYIHCHRAHYLTFENKQILPYKRWKQNISKVKPNTNNFLTGVGGVLYPPNCFYKDILRKDLFMKLAPQADDIWFWAMCVLNNKKINVVTGGQKLKYVEGTQETALCLSNVDEGKNDIQLNNIINYYPNLLKKLDKDNGFYKNIFERIFSIKNEGVRKVITIFGIKFKFKSKKLIKRREEKKKNEKIDKILKSVQSQKKVIKNLQEQISQASVLLSQQNQKLEQQDNIIKNTLNDKLKNLLSCQNDKILKLNHQFNNAIKSFSPQTNLRSIVYHLADHCNLKCQCCDHFAPLAKEKLADIKDFEKDIKRLSELTKTQLEIIKLMGGEPLLHPEIKDFMRISRMYFPSTRIEIVTNGILLNTQKEDFWSACKEFDITIVPTKYPLNIDYDRAKQTAKEYEVKYEYYSKDESVIKASYHIPLDLTGQQNAAYSFAKCFHANWCVMLKNGKLYTCTVAPNIEHFNKYFNKSIPLTDRDGIDIYKAQTIEEILDFLSKPIPFCKYCNVNGRTFGHEWGRSKKEIEEWT